jgi:hypothetical protein
MFSLIRGPSSLRGPRLSYGLAMVASPYTIKLYISYRGILWESLTRLQSLSSGRFTLEGV